MAATAETVGSTLGSVMAKVDAWMAQREEIARELRAAADSIMSGENPFRGQAAKAVAAAAPAERKKPVMSAAARKRISDAQKARWAKQKAEAAGETSKAKSAKKARKSG
jgi:hypothetical protein